MPRDHPLLPFLAVVAGIATFSLMDAAMKSASMLAGVYSALLFRNIVASALMVPVWLTTGGKPPGKGALKVHVQRSVVVACMAPLFFWGLVRIPMAEAIAISFVAPLIALYFAAVMLGETIRPNAIIASLPAAMLMRMRLAGRTSCSVSSLRKNTDLPPTGKMRVSSRSV